VPVTELTEVELKAVFIEVVLNDADDDKIGLSVTRVRVIQIT